MNKSSNLKIKSSTNSAVAIALMLIITFSIFALPSASAHSPPWNIPTYAYIAVSPNPVGIGQNVFVMMWIDWPPPTAAGTGGDRWQNYRCVIMGPDGKNVTKGPYTSDATSSAYFLFAPDKTGTYTFVFTFPGQVASLYNPLTGEAGTASSLYINDTFLASTATTTLTVQNEQLSYPPEYPLPTRYWTRPIEGENWVWYKVASNWLGTGSGQILGGGGFGGGGVQPDGIAPNSPHIMWTKPLQDGGVAGGNYATAAGATYYPGLSYEGRIANPLIIGGRLYYDTPLSDDATSGPYMCVDLATGQTLWTNPNISPSFGQLYDYESFNQHGVIGDGYLWQASGFGTQTWMAFDPRTGANLFNITGVPSGTTVYGPNGEILRYQLSYNRTANSGWLALWNNTACGGNNVTQSEYNGGPTSGSNYYQWRPVGKVINGTNGYSWNVTVGALVGLSSPAILSVVQGDVIIGTSTSFSAFSAFGTPDPFTFWAINLNRSRGTVGQILWCRNYTAPDGNLTLAYMGAPSSGSANVQVDAVNRVFFVTNKETMQWWGYDIDTGNVLWGPVGDFRAFQYYGTVSNPPAPGYVYDGTFYVAGYGGVLYAFDSRSGNVKWSYGNGGPGNSTNSGLDTPWGNYPLFIGAIADGKIYCFSSEHSPNDPLYKNEMVRAIDAKTGKEVWTMNSWPGIGSFGQTGTPIADGKLVYLNIYDMQIYCIGKGPSETAVSVGPKVTTKGSSVIIEGKVTDVSVGAKAKIEEGEFNSVPAVSDADQAAWMQYIYMQKPMPTNVVGVPVMIFETDSNGNTELIATVNSSSTGMFYYKWTPPQEGTYVIDAVFEGSESYWSSSATTIFGVDPAPSAAPVVTPNPTATPTTPPTATPTPTSTLSPAPSPPGTGLSTEIYIAVIAVVIIAVVAAVAIMLRRRK